MPLGPIQSTLRSAAPARSVARQAAKPAPAPAPQVSAGAAKKNMKTAVETANSATIEGRNLAFTGKGYAIDVPYLQAELLDKTPADPISLWSFGTYQIKVKAGQVRVGQADANQLLAAMAKSKKTPLSAAEVQFLGNNRLEFKGSTKVAGILPVPFSTRVALGTAGANTVTATAESLKLYGLPLLWAAKLLRAPLNHLLPADGSIALGRKGVVAVDLSKNSLLQGEVHSVSVDAKALKLTLGRTAPTGSGNYANVSVKGELDLSAATVRNAKLKLVDATPATPLSLNNWDEEGFARFEQGEVVLDEAKLRDRFKAAGGDFHLREARMEGTSFVVKGNYELLKMAIPLSFKVRFAPNAQGELKLTPYDVTVFGLGLDYARQKVVETLAGMPGFRAAGDGVVLDFRRLASVEMAPVRSVRAEPGKMIIST